MPNTTKKKKPRKKKKASKNKKAYTKNQIILIVLSSIAIIAIIAGFAVLNHGTGKRSSTIEAPDKEVAFGIDVSSHNGKIDWKTVKDNVDFAFIRVAYRGYTNGEINLDKRAKYNLKYANKYKIPVGVYIYSQAVNEAEAVEEADFVLREIKNYDISLPVVIDFEYASKNGSHTGRLWDAGLTKKERTALINAFCGKVRDAGYTPAIYASSYIYLTELNMKKIDDDVFIWVADYNKHVTYGGFYDIWQYTEKGKVDGVKSKAVDLDYWYTKNRLKKE